MEPEGEIQLGATQGRKRYTHVVDYDGGTYLFQVTADSAVEAIEISREADFPRVGIEIERLEEWRVVPVTGLKHVWCASRLESRTDELVLVHTIGSQD